MNPNHLLPLSLTHEIGRLLLAVALGGAVGWQRERHDHPAGLRTHILVCVASALIASVDAHLPDSGGKIAGQIVTGVGFLGAGAILRSSEGLSVHGLTTAASIWAIAGVGIAVGYGGLAAESAAITTLLILFTLTVVTLFENKLLRRRERQKLTLVLAQDADLLSNMQRILHEIQACGVKVRNFKMEQMSKTELVHFAVRLPHGYARANIDGLLSHDKAILHYDWDE